MDVRVRDANMLRAAGLVAVLTFPTVFLNPEIINLSSLDTLTLELAALFGVEKWPREFKRVST